MRQRVKELAAAVVFLILAYEVFIHCTYLFRNTERAARQNILGFYEEESDSLDVVCVGTSSVYRYWDPMHAWDLYGFISYDYSVSAMSRGTVLTAIKDLRRTQSPEVIVVDVRPFLNLNALSELDYPERNMLDSIDHGLTRLQGVKYLFDNSDISRQEAGAVYMELAQYHNNKTALAEALNWQLMDNRLNSDPDGEDFYKGFAIAAKHTYQSREAVQLSDETAEEISELYMDILEYGKEENLKLLFVLSPLAVSEQRSKIINKMALVAEEYGYGFIDGNRFCEEMDLDYTTDFYSSSHVNILGAEKWTKFVGDYLVQNYDLPDHRNDSRYDSWHTTYEAYQKEAQEAVNQTWEMIRNHDATIENEKEMRETDAFPKWFELANDENISILVCANACDYDGFSMENKELLRWFGIDEDNIGVDKKYYALYCDRTIHLQTTEDEAEGTIGGLEIPFTIQKSDQTRIVISEAEYDVEEGKIQLLAFDNNLNQTVDWVELTCLQEGEAGLRHLSYE
ncbi:MAG: hypothetical protein NC416_15770 [Eubacterium sp.]|nr:hypothetical protein [Eubacterium sp.]